MANTFNWDGLASIAMSLVTAGRLTQKLHNEVLANGGHVAHVIDVAYEYAGQPETNKAHQMLKCAQNIAAALETIHINIKEAKAIARGAASAVDEFEAQYATARAKLGN